LQDFYFDFLNKRITPEAIGGKDYLICSCPLKGLLMVNANPAPLLAEGIASGNKARHASTKKCHTHGLGDLILGGLLCPGPASRMKSSA
jgi:hypothetical protein